VRSFPTIVQFIIVAEVLIPFGGRLTAIWIPPPDRLPVFSAIIQFVIVAEESWILIPPPSPLAYPDAVLLNIVQLEIVREEPPVQLIPPPFPLAASLLLIKLPVIIGEELSSQWMPPPSYQVRL